jgi:hypothetical protein
VLLAACGSDGERFNGDFETGDLSQWSHVQAPSDRVEVVEDPVAQGEFAGRFEVDEGDEDPDTGSPRSEVRSGLEYRGGEVRYFRILSRVESWDFDEWGLIWQIHDDTDETPPLTLQLEDEGSGPELWLGPGSGDETYWEAPFPGFDTWFEVVVRVEFGAAGSVEVWLDGEQQTLENGETIWEDTDTLAVAPSYDKLGTYRSPEADETAVVYHDGYRVSDEFFSDPP